MLEITTNGAGAEREAAAPVGVPYPELYWRKQRRDGALKELGRSRGRKPADRRDQEIAELCRRNERLESELAKARKVITIQANVSALLEQMLATEGEIGSTER